MRALFIVLVGVLSCVTAFGTGSEPKGRPTTLSIDYADVEIREVLRDIADRQELNLVIPDTLQGRTSIQLRDVTWKQAFKVVLEPIGYTWVEDGQIVKIVAMEDLAADPMRKTGTSSALDDGPWYVVIAVCFAVGVLAICHIALCFGVLRDRPPGGAVFAPKIVWAILVLAGGVIPLVGYWLVHHSNLRSNVPPA